MGFRVPIALAMGLGLSLTSFTGDAMLSAGPQMAPDPTRLASFICGARQGGPSLLQALIAARALAAPASHADAIQLYGDLTTSPFEITTSNSEAQRYFSQGLMLTYGFNHAGAVRSFRAAQRLDPQCAMCWWGEALALGPNINAPMDDRDRGAALAAIDHAMKARAGATPKERALIEAMSVRYSKESNADRAALDAAYADAMLKVAELFPSDDDVAVLAAEAAMDTTPWNYWAADKTTPLGRSGEALRLVETVLGRNPAHLQAGHLYIHLLEASDPQRAEAAADRLASRGAFSAAHLVHMPSHIYQVRGRYAEAIRVNIAAARADETFIRDTGDRSLVRYGYYPHNVHFIVAAAQMAGDMDVAIREAARLRTLLDPETSAQIAWIQAIDAAPYLAMAQFAAPVDILAMPAPDARLPYATAMRHYARSIAYAQLRDRKGFDTEMAAMARLRTSKAFEGMIAQGMPAPDLISLAELVARGRLATAEGRYAEAAASYRKAVAIESTIPYQEPSYWYYPVRQSLGAALFLDGRYGEAAEVFRAALAQTPQNGWVLYGLARSEAAQGRKAEAAAARQALSRAWMGRLTWLRMERL